MYPNEVVEAATAKFNTFIDNYLNTLKEKLNNIITSLSYEKIIEKISTSRNLDDILAAKDILIELDSSMAEKYHILEYFIKNNATDIEQVSITINSMLNSNAIKNYSHNIESETEYKQELEYSISLIDQLKENSDLDFDTYVKLLEASDLKEEEKIIILVQKAYDSCLYQEEIVNEPLSEESKSRLEEIVTKYQELENTINRIISKNYDLIASKNDKELAYAKFLANNFKKVLATMQNEDEEQQMKYLNQVLAAKLISLIEEKKSITEILKTITQTKTFTKDLEEELELHFMEINDILSVINELSESLAQDDEEKNNYQASEIIFLLDTYGNPYFDLQNYSPDDKKRINSLVEKLGKGLEQAKKRIKHTKLQPKGKLEHDVFINKLSNMYCSYVRLAKNKILIVNFGDKDSIYDETESIVRKCSTKITKLKNNPKEFELNSMDPKQHEVATRIAEFKTVKGKEQL